MHRTGQSRKNLSKQHPSPLKNPMTWDDVLTRLETSGLRIEEETYMENYGKILAAQQPEFQDRSFRCTYGAVQCDGIRIELFLFPDEGQRNDFLEVIAGDPWWLVHENVVIHFPACDPAAVTEILRAIKDRES